MSSQPSPVPAPRRGLRGLTSTLLISFVVSVLFSIPFLLSGTQLVSRFLHEMGRSGMTDPKAAFNGIGSPLVTPFVLVTALVGMIAGTVFVISLLRLIIVSQFRPVA